MGLQHKFGMAGIEIFARKKESVRNLLTDIVELYIFFITMSVRNV